MENIVLGHKIERDKLIRGKYIPREELRKARESINHNLIKVCPVPDTSLFIF